MENFDGMRKGCGRISALLWADILVTYALFVMQDYLTGVWKLSFTHAAGILNIWGGISRILPVFFLFLVDALLGNFMMLVISSTAYSVGIGFITISIPPVFAISAGTCKQYEPQCIDHTQKVLFYTGMALIAVGISGNLVSVMPFLKQQKTIPDDNAIKCWLKVLGYLLLVLVPLIGAIALPYIKLWSLRFGIPAICTAVATLLFLSGWCTYDKDEPEGSPLTNVCRVFVASASKLFQPFPLDDELIHKKNDQELFSHTRCLRCLEKSAIILPDVNREDHNVNREDQVKYRWRLCSVGEVEEAKIAVRMVPMWITFIICGIVSSIGNTYFVEQANNMNRNIGKWKLPPQVLLLIFGLAKTLFDSLAGLLFKKPQKYAPPIGIAVAMTFSVLCCITAAKIEKRRLNVIRSHGLLDKPDEEIPMSIYWLLFQFVLLAGLDSFFEKSVIAFYNHQAPKSMENYLVYFSKGVSGLGFMCNVLSVYIVGKIKRGKTNWFQETLNKSRLDKYYWVLAALSSVNLIVFIVVALIYKYKNPDQVQGPEVQDETVPDTGGSDLPTDGNGEGEKEPDTGGGSDEGAGRCCCCG